MKKYKKTPTKLLQIRLSNKEYEEILELIKRFGVTKREWLSTVRNHIQEMNVIREGRFYPRHQEYAYQFNNKWDKQLREDSYCEVCSELNKKDERGYWGLCRHHHWGYEGENAMRVMILCKRCHGIIHGKNLLGQPIEKLKKFISTHQTHKDLINVYYQKDQRSNK